MSLSISVTLLASSSVISSGCESPTEKGQESGSTFAPFHASEPPLNNEFTPPKAPPIIQSNVDIVFPIKSTPSDTIAELS